MRDGLYEDVDEMYADLMWELVGLANATGVSSRDGPVVAEVLGWQARLDASLQKTLVSLAARDVSLPYAAAEVLWTLSGDERVEMPERYAPKFRERYAQPNGACYWAYGPRIMPQVQTLLSVMRKRAETRQGVIVIWESEDLEYAEDPAIRNVPCTLHWQFLVRDGLLHMEHSLRSNDAWLGFPYDVFTACCFQRLIARELGLAVGTYTHKVGSMHLYERYLSKARNLVGPHTPAHLGGTRWAFQHAGHGWKLDDGLTSAFTAVALERGARAGDPSENYNWANEMLSGKIGCMMGDLLDTCIKHVKPDWRSLWASPISPRMQLP